MDSASASGAETPCDWPGESWPTLNATRGAPAYELHRGQASVTAHLSAEAVTTAGSSAAANPFRWSTKRFDPESGSPRRISPQAELSDFGMRYYSATLGRWLNRDPIGDLGGANVYAYAGNNPTNRVDYLGLMLAECRPGEPCHSGLSSAGGDDPPQEKEEEDKKPCPKRPDLHQQSQPTTKPRGNKPCDPPICTENCSKEGNENVGGSTLCDGKDGVCTCVCPDNLEKIRKGENPVKDDDVFGAYKKCTEDHEGQHAEDLSKDDPPPCKGKPAGEPIPTTPERECRAYESEFKCIGESVPRDCLQRDSCKQSLISLAAARYAGCMKQCKSQERCEKLVKQALRRVHERSQSPR